MYNIVLSLNPSGPKETNSSRAYLLRLEDEQLSPCRISHKHLGTWQSHSSSNFHTENI